MTHNALSRSMDKIPMWLVQTIVGILLTSGVTWATWASVSAWKQETRITVTETKVEGINKSLDEIKAGQAKTNEKLDRLLERGRRR